MKATVPIIYALTQSKDDRTIDIVVSGQDSLVTEFTERKRIQRAIEQLAPFSDTKSILLRTGKNWMSGYLAPDCAGPNGRLRPVQFVAQDVLWKILDDAAFAESVCESVMRLLDSSEVSQTQLNAIRRKIRRTVVRRKRGFGCFPVIFALAVVVTSAILLCI